MVIFKKNLGDPLVSFSWRKNAFAAINVATWNYLPTFNYLKINCVNNSMYKWPIYESSPLYSVHCGLTAQDKFDTALKYSQIQLSLKAVFVLILANL